MFACCAASPRPVDADRPGVGRALPQSPIVETEAVVPPAPAAAPLAAAPTPRQQPAAGDGEAPAAASEAAATPVDERDPVPALVPVAATAPQAPQAAPSGGAAVQSDAIATSVTTTAPAPAPAATQPPAFVGDEDAVKQPLYAEWMKLYEQSRNNGEFERVVVFIETNPSAVNNRKGGAFNERLHPATPSLHVQYRSAMAVPSRARGPCGARGRLTLRGRYMWGYCTGGKGWTILHQACYWQVSKQLLARLKDVGADPTLEDWNGRLALEILSDKEVGNSERPTRTLFKQHFAELFHG